MGGGIGGLLKNNYKGSLDKGVARSIFENKGQLLGNVLKSYPQLKKNAQDLQFAYKVDYKGLVEEVPEAKERTLLTEEMAEPGVAEKAGEFFKDPGAGFKNMMGGGD